MDVSSFVSYLLLYLAIWVCCYLLSRSMIRYRSKAYRLPPGPFQLPFIGNLHQLGDKPHQSFAKLAKAYGPLMSVRLGSKKAVLVSSSVVAREVLQKQDHICSTRSIPTAIHSLDHHKFSMAWIPPSKQWRSFRKLCKEQIFATHRLDASQELRQEKLKELREYLRSCVVTGKAVNIGEAAFTSSLNLISRSLFSKDFASYDSSSSQELKEVVWGVMKNVGLPNLADFFHVLRWIDPQGIFKETNFYFGKVFDIFDVIIQERLQDRKSSLKRNDLLEAFLDHLNDSDFTLLDLKHLLLDLFVASIDTTSATVEWAMAELLRDPEKMDKARLELGQVIGDEGVVQEADIAQLPYLRAVVKETFRLHPATPLLLPHRATEDVEISGYTVPKDTQILINVWASGRDEGVWKDHEKFQPERFLESEIDVRGQHFELIPFGAGRRICPGLPLAYRMVHLMVASFIHNIGWKLEGGMNPKDVDMEEKFGLSVHKAADLKAIPVHL